MKGKIDSLIVECGMFDVDICQFFQGFPSDDFWIKLNTLPRDQWFDMTHEIIRDLVFHLLQSKQWDDLTVTGKAFFDLLQSRKISVSIVKAPKGLTLRTRTVVTPTKA